MAEAHTLHGVPIFAVGTWNGDIYTEADLDHMVAAFPQVGFQPPMKLGHDESQPLAKHDGMPAIGWVANLRRVGAQLYCDIKGLPRRVYEAIQRKNYNRVSAEVYWDYVCNGQRWPRVLKALSLLGADIPAVTSLGALEMLYDGEGQGFKRYDDLGMLPVSPPQIQHMPEICPDADYEKKEKRLVNYRQGPADIDKEGMADDRCGSCKFWQGPPDPNGSNTFIALCSLVEGECASTWVCDLYEAMEAFSAGFADTAKMSPSKSREYSDFTEQAWNGDKARFSVDQLKAAVPDAVRAWAEEQAKHQNREIIKEDLKLPFREPDGTVNLNGVRAALSAIGGSRTGKRPNDVPKTVLDEAQKQLRSVLDEGNRQGKNLSQQKVDARAKEQRYMEVKEVNGEFCVMKDGEKVECFATKEEADAYLVSAMAQSAAEVKALQQKLEAAEKQNSEMTRKLVLLEQTVTDSTQKFSEIEQRVAAAEAEANALKERNRQAGNQGWLSQMAHESNLKILPWERPYVAFLLDLMTGGQIKTYADNGVEIAPAEVFKKLYEGRKPGSILVEELARGIATETEGRGVKKGEYTDHHEARREATRLAKVYLKEHPEIREFSVAFRKVLEGDPELKLAVSGVTIEGHRKTQDGVAAMQQLFKK